MPQTLALSGKTFELVRVQRGGLSRVYRGDGEYLRIGEPRVIKKHLDAHTLMEGAGFRVPQLLTAGEHGGKAYFIEKSLGDQRLGGAFAEDWQTAGVVSDTHFAEFTATVDMYARAQLRAPVPPLSLRDLKAAIHVRTLCKELPEYAERIQARFAEIIERLSVFPNVLSHGDFNPQNLFSNGIIDLEHACKGPWGYDLVTALVHIDQFPDSDSYEYFARYRFSWGQREKYLAFLDGIASENDLPKLSDYVHDFEFCRAVWSAVRMHEWPKLQKWRYDVLIRKYFS